MAKAKNIRVTGVYTYYRKGGGRQREGEDEKGAENPFAILTHTTVMGWGSQG